MDSHEFHQSGRRAHGEVLLLALRDRIDEAARREGEEAHRRDETEAHRPDIFMRERQGQPEQQLQRLVYRREAEAKQACTGAGKQRAKPKAMIEQPEIVVGLAAAEMAGQGQCQSEARQEQGGAQPDGGIEPEHKAEHRHAEQRQQRAGLKRAMLALRVKNDSDRPDEGRGEPRHDPELDVADHGAVIELVDCQQRGEPDGKREARGRGADIRKLALPPGFDRALVHVSAFLVPIRASLPCAKTGKAD